MRIELNAGGLDALVSIADFQLEMRSAYNSVEDVVDVFQSVKKYMCNLNGGVGNLQDASEDIQARIDIENRRLANIETIQKKTNDFLSLAIRVDMQVSKRIDSNKHEFYGKYEWSKPSVKNTLKNIGNKLKGVFNDVKDFLQDAKDALVDWYENHGGKELLNIIGKIALTTLVVVGFIFAPEVTFLGVASLVITLGDTMLDVYNETQAYGKKREALQAESEGDHERAAKLRNEASNLSDESSWRDRWGGDGKNDWRDFIAFGTNVIEILDLASSGKEIISDIGEAGSVSKWFSNGLNQKDSFDVADFVINDLFNFSTGVMDKVSDGTIAFKNGSLGLNITVPKFEKDTFDVFIPIPGSPISSPIDIMTENIKNFFKS